MDCNIANMDADTSSDVLPKPQQLPEPRHPRKVTNRSPTPQDLLELSARVYRSSRKLYHEADSQGMRVYHDELIMGDVRMVMLVPSWFPKAHVAFDWGRLRGDTVSVVLVLRGTMQDLVGNTRANLQLIFNKLVDDQHLPDVAADATKASRAVVQAWLLELLLRHPALDARAAGGAAAAAAAASPQQPQQQQQQAGWPLQLQAGGHVFGALPGMMAHQQQQQQQQEPGRQLKLDIHTTGHSLGGLLAEVATIESHPFAAAHGADWHCTSFEGPGLPDLYHRAALRAAPAQHWNDVITSYLAAPNPINMLYEHLGSVVHVVVPWEQTWSHVAKCVGADVARVTAWAIVGGMIIAGAQQLAAAGTPAAAAGGAAGLAGRRQRDDDAAAAAGRRLSPGGLLQAIAGGGAGERLAGNARAGRDAAAAVGRCSAQQALQAGLPAGGALGAPAGTMGPGPVMPTVFTVSETGGGFAAAGAAGGGRTLASIGTSLAGASMAAAAQAAAGNGAAAAAAGAAAAKQSSLSAAAAGAAAALGEAAVSANSARLLQLVGRRCGLGVVANVVGGWMLGRGGIMGALECVAGVLGVEVEELVAQHALGPMRQCFDPHTGQLKARYRRDMAAWPSLGRRRKVLLAAARQVAKWSLPSFVCRDNVGVANIGSRTAMVEARCARLQGYVILQQPVAEDTAAAVGLVGAAAAAAAARSSPELGALLDAEEELLLHSEAPQQQQQLAAAGLPQLPERGRLHRKMLQAPQQQQLGAAAAAEHLQEQQMQEQLEGVVVQNDGYRGAAAGSSAAAAGAAGLYMLEEHATAMELDGEGCQSFGAAAAAGAGRDWLLVEPGWADADESAGLRARVSAGEVSGVRQGLGFASAMDDDEEELMGAAGRARTGGRGGAMQLAFGGH
ncbi:hypothetical protein COO60DRAFT_1700957 [Scenedesmus sp. NREL 46B-D3]|nr:hypothetical protein COO60DRAFT_1700957 [Scenedesmus sp. NREL 46B-D3]